LPKACGLVVDSSFCDAENLQPGTFNPPPLSGRHIPFCNSCFFPTPP
jgi:hypothetical protein